MRLRVLVPGTDPARGLDGNDNGGAFRLETVLTLRGGRRLHAFEDKVMHHLLRWLATLAEYKDGKLIPFPNPAMSLPSPVPAADRLVSVHGMTTDTEDRL